jgi:hypothetical protein
MIRSSLFAATKRRILFVLKNPFGTISETTNKVKVRLYSNESDLAGPFKILLRSRKKIDHVYHDLNELLERYTQNSASFDKTKSLLSEYISNINGNSINMEARLSIEQMMQSYGFFCNSLEIFSDCDQYSSDQLRISRSRRENWTLNYRYFLLSMSRGEIVYANDFLKRLRVTRGSEEPFRKSVISEMDHYLFLASNGKFGSRIGIVDKDFANLIADRDVVVIGPGQGSQTNFSKLDSDTLVVRMIKPGLLDWSSEYSETKLSEIGYISGETSTYLERKTGREWANQFTALCFRQVSTLALELNNGRQLVCNHHLLLRGAPHMLLYAIWDLTIHQPKSIKIANVDFYSTPTPLRSNSRRTVLQPDGSEIQVSIKGSTGELFDRCRTHAMHGIVHNRNVIKMLTKNSMFSLSPETSTAIDYSDKEYCRRLENSVGRMRT